MLDKVPYFIIAIVGVGLGLFVGITFFEDPKPNVSLTTICPQSTGGPKVNVFTIAVDDGEELRVECADPRD